MTLPDISTDAAGLALWVAIGTAVCAVLAEWWHSRRIRRVGRLAFGPLGQAQIEPDTRDTRRRLFTASDAASYAASQSTAELRASLADLEQVIHELN